jgi:hypothetical protein
MAELVLYMAAFMLVSILALWIIEQHCPKTAERIESFLQRFD